MSGAPSPLPPRAAALMLNKDPQERFSATAELYGRYRPSYPPALRDFLLDLLPTNTAGTPLIADVGCGTGISTRLVAGPGVRVIGIDPNRDMLAQAAAATPAAMAIEYRVGEATATGLDGGTVALITVAQAFHWFDIPSTLAEFARILVPGGRCAVYWNLRASADSPFLAAYDALLERYSTEYGAVPKGETTIERLAATPEVRVLEQAEFVNLQPLDHQGFLGRVYSSSYVTHGVPPAVRPEFDRALDSLFREHARQGEVTFAYTSRVLAFELEPAAAAKGRG
jgi:SAM-dependent methyltransferase